MRQLPFPSCHAFHSFLSTQSCSPPVRSIRAELRQCLTERRGAERERTHPQVLPTEDQAAAWGGTEFQLGGESHSITHEPISVDISVETSRAPSRESLAIESKPSTGYSTAVSHSLRSLFARTWIQQVISSSFSGLLHRLVCVPQSRSKPALSTLSASFSTALVEP